MTAIPATRARRALQPPGAEALRQLVKRRPVSLDAGEDTGAVATSLRAFYHPKQRLMFGRGGANWRATSKTRRSGATAGGVREFLARALEQPGFCATYFTTTRDEAKDRAWLNDSKSGFFDVIMRMGDPVRHPTLDAYKMGGVTIEVRQADLELRFSNGSHIELFGADNMRSHRKKRGNAKHVFWGDEAQDFPGLEEFFDRVVIGSLTDTDGECWLTGTPGIDCAGMFYEITKEEDDGEERMANWDVHTMSVVDNPFFGRVLTDRGQLFVEDNVGKRTGPYDDMVAAEKAAAEVRWSRTAGAAMVAKGWKGDEPDFVREWLGRWVRTDARYVYPVHAVPKHRLIYAPQRLAPNPFVGTHKRFEGHPPWFDFHAAVRDLPRAPKGRREHQWLYVLGADFGYNPDPFALVLWAFTPDLPEVFEMFSWKQIRTHTDDQGAYMKLIWDQVPSIIGVVGDPAGKRDDFDMWRDRMGLPIEEANKQGKSTLEEFLADDIRRERVHLREGSQLHLEMKHLVYMPTKPGKERQVFKHRVVNGVVHGDHCCFVAGTMVETSMGPRAIESIAVGDLVYTRDGLRHVGAAGPTGEREVWRLNTEDGSFLVGTGDHPIWTEDGWTPLADLMPGVTLTKWESTDAPRPSSSTVGAIDATPMPHIGLHASTSRGQRSWADANGQSDCTVQSGNTTTGPSQMASTSTIGTRTLSTTISPTSSSSPVPSIAASMPRQQNAPPSHAQISSLPGPRLPSGTGRLAVLPGMPSTDVGRWQSDSLSSASVLSAASDSTPRGCTLSHAAMRVEPRSAVPTGLMTSTASVRTATSRSGSTATASRSAARTRVLRVERAGRDIVYNLTVAGTPEYFANGILVHNCDASRYSYTYLHHYLAKLPTDKPPVGSDQYWRDEEEREQRAIEDAETRRARMMADGDELMTNGYERGGAYGDDWG